MDPQAREEANEASRSVTVCCGAIRALEDHHSGEKSALANFLAVCPHLNFGFGRHSVVSYLNPIVTLLRCCDE
jgi:hypothetical protein